MCKGSNLVIKVNKALVACIQCGEIIERIEYEKSKPNIIRSQGGIVRS